MGLARRVAASVGGALALVVLVLGVEVGITMSRDYLGAQDAPPVDANLPAAGDSTQTPLRLVVLGDSTAAGVGATQTETTVAWRLAAAVVASAEVPVQLRTVAVSGAQAEDLAGQVDRALEERPQVAVILIGANDVTHLTPLGSVRADLAEAVRRLRGAGAQVVVGTCPDMGAVTAMPRPLRDLAGWRGFDVAEVEREAVQDVGGEAVDLARLTGPAFRAAPEVMLSVDQFHPSDEGYALWALVLSPAVEDAARSAVSGSTSR